MDTKRDILFDLDKIANYLKPYREYANTEYNWRVPLEAELLDGLIMEYSTLVNIID